MTHAITTTELFLVAMVVIFAVPYLVWRLCRTDYWAPLVVVQIIAGILLGPGVLGKALPELHATVFNRDVILALNGVAWWAVMLFVMIAGIELDVRKAWASWSRACGPNRSAARIAATVRWAIACRLARGCG